MAKVGETPRRKDDQCEICGMALADPTMSSYRGYPVHNGCFARRGGRHRESSRPGRKIKGASPLKPWLREHHGIRKVRGRWREVA